MELPFPLDNYSSQKERWPSSGRHIMANYDDHKIVVYQAYNPSIGHLAVQHQDFVSGNTPFSLNRMSWIKPGFLWMMYRSEWGTKPDQTVILAISLSRSWFDEILREKATLSSKWARDQPKSPLVVQWDPDHDPLGQKEPRRAIQIGMRDDVALEFAKGIQGRAVMAINDISEFVHQSKVEIIDKGWPIIKGRLATPIEKVYNVDEEIRQRLQMD